VDVFQLDHFGAPEFALAIIYDSPDSGNALWLDAGIFERATAQPQWRSEDPLRARAGQAIWQNVGRVLIRFTFNCERKSCAKKTCPQTIDVGTE
jgi:hypothetical protein